MQKSCIRIGTITVEVRNQGKREINFEGKWMTTGKFVELLIERGMTDELVDLAKGACLLQPEEAKKLIQGEQPVLHLTASHKTGAKMNKMTTINRQRDKMPL